MKPPTKSVAGCNPASVNLFWIVYQNNNNFKYKSFLDPLIFAGSLLKMTKYSQKTYFWISSSRIVFRLGLIIHNHPIPEDSTSFQLEYLESGQNFEYSGWNNFLWLTVFGFKNLIHRKHFFLVVNEHWRARLNHRKNRSISKNQNIKILITCMFVNDFRAS